MAPKVNKKRKRDDTPKCEVVSDGKSQDLDSVHAKTLFTPQPNGGWKQCSMVSPVSTEKTKSGKTQRTAPAKTSWRKNRTMLTSEEMVERLERLMVETERDESPISKFYSSIPVYSLSRQLIGAPRLELVVLQPSQSLVIRIFQGPKSKPDKQRLAQVMVLCPSRWI